MTSIYIVLYVPTFLHNVFSSCECEKITCADSDICIR